MAGLKQVVFGVAAVVLGSGCYSGLGEADHTDEMAQMRELEFNTTRLNNIKLNNIKLNNIKLNNIKLNNVKLNNVKLNNVKLNGFALDGSEFYGVIEGEVLERRGADLIGTEIELTFYSLDDNNQEVTEIVILRIDDAYLDEQAPGSDVWLYDITYKSANSDEWAPICESGYPVVPVRNYWDDVTGDRIDDADAVTLACTDAVIGKCVTWGYQPYGEAWNCPKWDSPKKCDLISLQDHHQACTRMARADYCGDGVPWTVPGTAIDIYDHLYPQIETLETQNWQIEAEWDVDGAYCLQDIRLQSLKQEGKYPKCKKKSKSSPRKDCGSLKNHRALLVSSFAK